MKNLETLIGKINHLYYTTDIYIQVLKAMGQHTTMLEDLKRKTEDIIICAKSLEGGSD